MKAIAAMSLNRVIGRGGQIPWHLPEDFKWFKKMTVGNVTVKAVKGGLDVPDPENSDPAVIASAAIAVRIDVP